MSTDIVPLDISKDLVQTLGQQFDPLFSQIRIYGTIDEPVFVAKDVTAILKLENLHIRDKPYLIKDRHWFYKTVATKGGPQKTIVLTELGLYATMFQSEVELARQYCEFIVIVMKNLRTQGVVTMETALKELKENFEKEKAKLLKTNKMLDDTCEDLHYDVKTLTEQNENQTNKNYDLNDTIAHLREKIESLELTNEKVEDADFISKLREYAMKPVYIFWKQTEDEDYDVADPPPSEEAYTFKLSTKQTLKGYTMVHRALMFNTTNQIAELGVEHETCLNDLLDQIESNNQKYLNKVAQKT